MKISDIANSVIAQAAQPGIDHLLRAAKSLTPLTTTDLEAIQSSARLRLESACVTLQRQHDALQEEINQSEAVWSSLDIAHRLRAYITHRQTEKE